MDLFVNNRIKEVKERVRKFEKYSLEVKIF